jgi:hypothetical protein
MSPVLDKVSVTSPATASNRYFSRASLGDAPHWISAVTGTTTVEASAPQSVISEDQYRVVSRELHCTVEQTETGSFIAAEPVIGVFGAGQDLNEALHDLFFALHEHREVLERQDSLSAGLREQLDYLNALL